MLRIHGKHLNSAKYFHEGHLYYLDSRGSGTIFRCCAKNSLACPAKIYADNVNNLLHLDDRDIQVVGIHNHEGDPMYILKQEFLQELEQQASTTFEDLKLIYDRVKLKPE